MSGAKPAAAAGPAQTKLQPNIATIGLKQETLNHPSAQGPAAVSFTDSAESGQQQHPHPLNTDLPPGEEQSQNRPGREHAVGLVTGRSGASLTHSLT